MTSAVRVHQIVNGDQFSVLVSFEPSRVIVDGKHPLEVLLSPLEAALLDHELGKAASPPPTCKLCDDYAIGEPDLCAEHRHRAEVEKNLSLGLEP